MSKKVLLLNAPPFSGKDYAADFLVNLFKGYATKQEFKTPLFKAVKSTYGISEEVWKELYTVENKDKPTYYLVYNDLPISPRQAMINMSEKVMKPLFGDDVFGLAAANQLVEGLNVFSDSGFMGEAQSIIDAVGKENVYVIKIIKDGCNFDNDSRDWLDTNKLGVTCMPVYNAGDESFIVDILSALKGMGIPNE